MILESIQHPRDLRGLDEEQLRQLSREIRDFIIKAVSVTGGHLGSNLGAVELTLAIHRAFNTPNDIVLWDTGHQAYAHKIITGRKEQFSTLRQPGGLSGYPSRCESEFDWVENSHASTILSYAHGLSAAVARSNTPNRKIVAVIGDGSMTGGMAYEGLNNLGHSGSKVVIVLNDNGRSYAPTVSRLSESLTRLRLHPGLRSMRSRVEDALKDIPRFGPLAYTSLQGFYSAIREVVEPPVFFESLGVKYVGPIDGHDTLGVEKALRQAADVEEPIVVHVLTQKGRGYGPAEQDDEKCLHDTPVFDPAFGPSEEQKAATGFTQAFSQAMVEVGQIDPSVVAITAAMPGPTGLLPFAKRWPDRTFDVGIAEQTAVTTAAGMALGGLKPVVAIYSTFFTRAIDQTLFDVGLHHLPVVFALDRAGITGDDGPSHHGALDMALCLKVPDMTIFAPSSAEDLPVMLNSALLLSGPSVIRYPKTPAPKNGVTGIGLSARRVVETANKKVCILSVGKMLSACQEAVEILKSRGIDANLWDTRVIRPPDNNMLADAAAHELVVTVEDGIRVGGAGAFLSGSIADLSETRHTPPTLNLGLPVAFIPHGKADQILSQLGLDAHGIASSIEKALQNP